MSPPEGARAGPGPQRHQIPRDARGDLKLVWPLVLGIVVAGLGVAGQNIGGGLVGLALLFWRPAGAGGQAEGGDWRATAAVFATRGLWTPLAWATAFLASLALATALNPATSLANYPHFLAGYVWWWLVPPLVVHSYRRVPETAWRPVLSAAGGLSLGWALIAISQRLWGWQLAGNQVVYVSTRAQALFSHPLTFAYAALLLWPLGVVGFCRYPGEWRYWLIAAATGCSLVFSESRTVQLVALACLAYNVVRVDSRVWRWRLVGAAAALMVVTAVTDNPVTRKIRETVENTRGDRESGYADDRVAIWKAHWTMVEERPLFGHGVELPDHYRDHGYRAVGLNDFTKKLAAHNMFLEVLFEGGVAALAFFVGWLAWFLLRLRRLGRASFGGSVALQTFVVFALASLTQNGFQDSGVRFVLTGLCAAAALVIARTAPGTETMRTPASGV